MKITDRDDGWGWFDRWIVLRVVCDMEIDLTTAFWVIVAGLLAWGLWSVGLI